MINLQYAYRFFKKKKKRHLVSDSKYVYGAPKVLLLAHYNRALHKINDLCIQHHRRPTLRRCCICQSCHDIVKSKRTDSNVNKN